MKAAIRRSGGIVFVSDYRKPKCDKKGITVKVKAAAINPVDYKIGWPMAAPVVGFDFSGVIEEIGDAVSSDYKVGDEVYGSVSGSLAEFASTDPDKISHRPKTIGYTEAAAMNVTYLTAVKGIRDYGKLKPGGRILIIGASGGCGTAAIQISKAMGATDIVGVCSGKNSDFIKSLGATEVIDYNLITIEDYCRGTDGELDEGKKFDVIYDAATNSGAGEDYKDMAMRILRKETENTPHGQYVAINGYRGMWIRLFTIGFPANQHLFYLKPSAEDLQYLAKLVDDGWTNSSGEKETLKPIIHETFPLSAEGVEKGFEVLKSRRARGKIVFDMDA